LQLTFSGLAALGLFILSLLFAAAGVGEILSSPTPASNAAQFLLMASGMAFAGILTLPSGWYALRRLLTLQPGQQKPVLDSKRGEGWVGFAVSTFLLIVLLPPVLLVGNQIARNDRLSWLLLPILNILATGLPVLWLVYLGRRGLSGGSSQRTWGVFASGLVLGPALILILELAAVALVGFLGLIWIFNQPGMANKIMELAQSLNYVPPTEETILNLFEPYLMRPGVLLTVLVLAAVIVPLIEEALKPIGVWLLAWRDLTPVEGFVAGLISGAGFALFENIGNTSTGGADWALLAASRISTALLHILTSGLMGWALVSAWRRGRYFQLGVSYALAVFLHGLWNGLALLAAGSFQSPLLTPVPETTSGLEIGTIMSLVALGLTNFGLFLWFNYRLRRSQVVTNTTSATSLEQG
jgi:RsiW-degrading membrane proteinase PrsW (M82 family)